MMVDPDAKPKSPAQEKELADVPDRLCTWCKVPMIKRLVGGGQFVHYTCPKCIFQHAMKREKKE
jgi:ssDNA-binding Zn-finger/Zn-ribbon topoisomerase 1